MTGTGGRDGVQPRAGGRVVVVGDVIDDVVVRPLEAVTRDSDTRAVIARSPGGSAANLACWLGAAGAVVTFVGRVGAADVARHTEALERFGVDARLAADPDCDTGSIVILVDPDDGARTMFTDRGANLALVADDVEPGLVEDAALLHLSGYSFVDPDVRRAALDLMARARRAGVAVSVDPSSASFLAEVGAEDFLAWTAGARLCFPNHDEARVLTGLTDPTAAAALLSERYELVAVTCGADGAVVAAGGQVLARVVGPRVEAVDSTGAGDAFCAGFLARWSAGETDPLEAARAGVALARDAVGRMGARPRPATRSPAVVPERT